VGRTFRPQPPFQAAIPTLGSILEEPAIQPAAGRNARPTKSATLVTVCTPSLERLKTGACQLWWWRLSDGPAALLSDSGVALLSSDVALLSSDELARYRRFLVQPAAQSFLAARVLVRSILSAYCGVPPVDWRFENNPWGKPRISSPACPTGLRFNLSHKPGFVVCLVGLDRELGVDVEDITTGRVDLPGLADRFFAPSESAQVRALDGDARIRRFYQLWTLKEAYLKARGFGITLGLDKFSFSFDASSQIRFDPGVLDSPDAWDFHHFYPDPHHIIAAAVSAGSPPAAIDLCDASAALR